MRGPKIKLNAARVNAGLTQTEVARKLNRNKQTIVNWEKGFTQIKVNDLLALSELYGIPIEYLEIPKRRKEDS
ncbi:MAG: helix-turn-helix transcriptional regulator [Eubacteriales bacterium]|jgi:transcriptional regulator with XRE-family HTH domain